jgi:hypothetical protein
MAKTHVIGGVTYVEVDREAEVGDKVLVFNTDICEVIDDWKIHGQTVYKLKRPCGKELQSWFDEDCLHVLEPLEATPDVTDILANLARRVNSLEQQLRDTQSNVEKLAEELANTRYRVSKHAERVEMLIDDIITLDARSQVLNAINKFYEEGSR